jgi:tetratricopeptide repeat protein 30
MQQKQTGIPDGQKTKAIYSMINEQRYDDAIKVLTHELQFCPKGRVASLLGYCHSMKGNYAQAARVYEELSYYYPDNEEYKFYTAQFYYKQGDYESALRVCNGITSPEYLLRLQTLLGYVKYETNDLTTSLRIAQTTESQDASFIVLEAAVYLKQGRVEEALKLFEKAKAMFGSSCEIIYNVALAHFKNKEYDKCMHYIAEIIEKGTRDHPELCVGLRGENAPTVPNSLALKESALTEAFNLKAAIEYNLKNIPNAKEALMDMPQRKEEDLDPVTLLNQALLFFDSNPSESFRKMNFLLENPPFPDETFSNLLLLYAKFEYFDLAADVLAENSEMTFKFINPDDFEYIDTLIFQNASLEDAVKRFEELGRKHLDNLKRVTRQIKEAQNDKDNTLLQRTLKEYDENLERYIPVLMAHAKIFWNKGDYAKVEQLLKSSQDYCSINDTWRLNLAHVYFAQEKYTEALTFYESIYHKNLENLLEIPAIIIANLCVSGIMINENEKAEDVIRNLEEAENKELEKNPGQNYYHLCIVNLVIGTLYCAKNQFEFGIGRIIKSFDPLPKKLSTDTWFYAKRCFLALLEKLAKNMYLLEDKVATDILRFLIGCEEIGHNIQARIDPGQQFDEKNNVMYEARLLRLLFIKLKD